MGFSPSALQEGYETSWGIKLSQIGVSVEARHAGHGMPCPLRVTSRLVTFSARWEQGPTVRMGFSPSALQKDQETGGGIKSSQIGISVGARPAVPA